MAGSRVYFDVVHDAARLLGAQVRAGRRERRWTAAELARRGGISRVTLLKVEHGDPTVSLGIALQVAALVGVPLFDRDERRLAADARAAQAALIGRRVRPAPEPEADLDF
ncbi:MAG: helix-turn-helix transcriptional regulator [Dehalococcoidia bacterium]